MGDQGTVRALTSVRQADATNTQRTVGKPLIGPGDHPSNSNLTKDRTGQNRLQAANSRLTKQHLQTDPGVRPQKSDKGHHQGPQSGQKGSVSHKTGSDRQSGTKGSSHVHFAQNGVTESDKQRHKAPSTSSSKLSDRQGTFVKEADGLSAGFEVPRITSASMPQKQVIRTDAGQREREVIVSIVEGGDSPDHVRPVTDTEAKLGRVKDTLADTHVTKTPAKSSNVKPHDGLVKQTKSGILNNNNKHNVNNQHQNGGKTNMDNPQESKENHLNTVPPEKTVDKTLEQAEPFRVSNSGNIEAEETGSVKHSKLLPPKTPVPAEPVIHKKSDFVSQNKKKPTSDSPQSMATYDASSMVRQAALASDKSDDKPLPDDRIERLTAMLNQVSEKLAESEDRNKVLTQQNEELQEQARRHTEVQGKSSAELQLLKNEWNELTKDLEASRKEREKIEEQLKGKGDEDREQIQTLTEQNDKLDKELTQAKADMKELIMTREKENKANEDIMEALRAELAGAKQNVSTAGNQYESELKELQETINRLKIENEALLQKVQKLEEGKADVEKGMKSALAENEELKEKLRKINTENQELVDQLSKAKSEMSHLTDYKKESDDLGEEVETLLREKHSLTEAVQEKDRIIEKQQNDIKSIDGLAQTLQLEQDQNSKLAKQVNSLTEENLSLRKQANDTNTELTELRGKMSSAKEKVETGKVALSSMSELIKEKQAHIEDLQKEVKTLAETNSNYLVAIEAFSSSKKKDDDVAKSKMDDIESSYKRLLEENKRLRTVLAHKNMSETSRSAESDDLLKVLDKKEEELDRAKERIVHLETMLDDVYKTREIQMMQSDLGHEDETKMSISSLPEIRQDSRATGYSNGTFPRGRTKSQENRWANTVERGQVSRNLRNYRDAQGYAKRYEHRPKRNMQTGGITRLK